MVSATDPVVAAPQVGVERLRTEDADAGFGLREVPPPVRNDAATGADFRLVLGKVDPNSGGLAALHDGRLPGEEDDPRANFFFAPGTAGGRVLVDLGSVRDVARVHTYSWHNGARGPQVFTLFASLGDAPGFVTEPGAEVEPATVGWSRLAAVDTRPASGDPGGQYGVSVSDPAGSLGRFRYLLFDVARTEAVDPFGNTFFGEIDVIERDGPALEPVAKPGVPGAGLRVVELAEGSVEVRLDTTATPDLTPWAEEQLVPLVQDWYLEIARILASDGFEAPRRVSIVFRPEMAGVAATSGTRVMCAARWFRENLAGEAKGAVFHELVHVVQQYSRAPARQPGASRPPGWLVEGLADYLRWYRYEPRSGGASIPPARIERARYDGSYRVSANFVSWVVTEHGPQVVRALNASMREGRYRAELWRELTGQSVEELGAAWKAELGRQRRDGGSPAR